MIILKEISIKSKNRHMKDKKTHRKIININIETMMMDKPITNNNQLIFYINK